MPERPRDQPGLDRASLFRSPRACVWKPTSSSERSPYGCVVGFPAILDDAYPRENVMSKHRSELQNEVARALIESKAVDLEVVGKVLGQFGARAALSGETIGAIIGRRCWDICIPPEPYGVNVAEIAGTANR